MNKNLERDRYIRKVTWIGLLINIALSGIKFWAGIVGRSQAIVADAIHSLSDTITDVAVIIGSYYWSKPPDDSHQHGHRRFETFVTLFIGILLIWAGIEIGWMAIITINEFHQKPPGWIAAAAAVLSIICKEALYKWTVWAGKKIKSPALMANAWHHRLDAISSIPAFFAVIGAIIVPSWFFLDHIGAIIVSFLIIQAAFKIMMPSIKEFMDFSAPKEICEEIEAVCLEHKYVKEVHKVRTRYIGMSLQVDFHLLVDASLSVYESHNIAGAVKKQILDKELNIVDVLIHVEPY
ncbi:MAG: cation transporter [Desulfobacterales bacterium]|nr:cation transporter [Desulfobacterales bacterium]